MTRRLPALNSLRAFEAAGRCLSFTKAAVELSVTPAAVSQQIKQLEDYFGVALFQRISRGLLLTDAGQRLLPGIGDGLDRLSDAVRSTHLLSEANILTVSVSPSFGSKWLVPRLETFRQAHPKFDVRIDATDRLVDFERENVDVAIRYGSGVYPGLCAEALLSNYLFPVCSPELISGPHAIRTPQDLQHHTLLHLEWKSLSETAPVWDNWLRAAGVSGISAERGPRFTTETMGVQAAIEGQGVLLASTAVVSNDLARGNLVRPFGSMQEAVNFTYFLVYSPERIDDPRVLAFRTWIKHESRIVVDELATTSVT